MDRNEYESLLNREIDGLLTPEEEARLNDYTARNPEAAAEQSSMHEIHRAFQSMEREPVPAGLSDRIADSVLAGPAPIRRFPSPWALNKVAAAILVVCMVGIAVWKFDPNTASADTDDAETRWALSVHSQWVEKGLTSEQADQIVQARKPFRGMTATAESNDKQTGLVLGLLKEFGHLDRYCEENGLTLEEAERLIERAK